MSDFNSETLKSERRRAFRLLLNTPLLTAAQTGDTFRLLRRHETWLREWLAHHPAWPFQLTSDAARLRKNNGTTSRGLRPARDKKNGSPFSRRAYVLLCLALGFLEKSDRQTTLGRIAQEVSVMLREDPLFQSHGIDLDIEIHEHRRDLIQIVRWLLERGILTRIQGDESSYLGDTTRDVLYTIHRALLTWTLNTRRSPSTVTTDPLDLRIQAITEEIYPDTHEGRNQKIRATLFRRLLDEPVLYYASLSPEELTYLHGQRSLILRQIEDATGLIAEIRREGIALLDEEDELSDIGIPEEGTEGHHALLFAEWLAENLRKNPENPGVDKEQLHALTKELIGKYSNYWRKTLQQTPHVLTDNTLARLEALDLIDIHDTKIHPKPAIARFAPDEPVIKGGKNENRE